MPTATQRTNAEWIGDTLVWQGGEIKSTGPEGKFGGYGILFSTAGDPDLSGDFFTKECDFGLEIGTKRRAIFNHGFDPVLKRRKLSTVDLTLDDVGVWVEGILEERDEYEKAVGKMVASGKLGFSSGSASHMVEREAVGKSMKIVSWPIIEVSLTPTPCEPRTRVMPLKSIALTTKGAPLGYDDTWRDGGAASAAIDYLARCLTCCVSGCFDSYVPEGGTAKTKAERLTALRAEFEDFAEDSLRIVGALLDDDAADPTKDARALFKTYHDRVLSRLSFADHSELVLATNEALTARHAALFGECSVDGRKFSDARRARVKTLVESLSDLLAKSDPGPDPSMVARLKMIAIRNKHRVGA